jgi:Fe-S oxidoreductase
MLKQGYPWLDGSEDANLVAAHTYDLFEYLAGLHAEGQLDTRFPNPPGKIAYQLPCHLKAQNLGTKSADVLRLTGAEVETVERCSAVDGTWGLKKEYFELSMKLAGPLFRDIRQAVPDRVATDCPLAALTIKQGTGTAAQHPIRILADAYGLAVD